MQAIRNISDVDACRILETVIQSIKTTAEVGEAAARVTAAAAAIAARTTVAAAARTVAGVLKAGLFAAKIGGAVVSAILIPVDVVTIYRNSKAIHYKEESEAAKHIRKLAKEIQAIQIFATSEINPSDTGLDEARDLRRQLENLQNKVSKNAAEREAAERERQQIEYKLRRQTSNISEAVLTALEKIPHELTQLSNLSTKIISQATQLKLVCCFLELAGCLGLICHIVAVAAGSGSAPVENASHAVIIIGGVMGLVAELYTEMFQFYRWREAVSVVDKYLFAAITLSRVRAGGG
ncbi:uncharacterized protein LOC124277685 [Haliotis rubra]|uniref:uncharacterized protein LOC124277685 n=1 Tax=Haliotis rubra TaxID=36100 RepID=UPI001EE53718|nr:uncharacterized protein LOC124277685 [Haliotis rubra]